MKVSPMKNTKQATVKPKQDRKRTTKDRDLDLRGKRNNKRLDQFVSFTVDSE